MANHYSVVQYVPDPLTDERVNIGVLVFDRDGVQACRFLEQWSRVKAFGGDVQALQKVVHEIEQANLSADDVHSMVESWNQSIQVTVPRASLVDSPRLLEQISAVMLREIRPASRSQGKLNVIRLARETFESAIRNSERAEELQVEPRGEVPGRLDAHNVDLTVRNGHLIFAAKAISFERTPSVALKKDIAETLWTLDDIGSADEPPTLAVLTAPPNDKNRDDYRRARNLFEELNATVLEPRSVQAYAREFVASSVAS
jgi:Protein of unknown function (DUF3037)